MTIRKPIAGFFALLLLFGTVFGLPEAGYAAGGPDYRSDLVLNGAEQDTWYAGDEIQLDLRLARTDGGSFGVRLYDNEITVDTSRLEVVECTAAAISGVTASINSNYQVNQEKHTQTIKWLYTTQNPKTGAGPLTLGSIRLRVKANPAEGTAAISQSVQGMADQTGAEFTDVAGNGLSFAVTNDLPSYYVGLRITDGTKTAYAAGESFTLQAYVTSSGVQFHADLASTTILLDEERFAVTSAQWGGGVSGSYDQTEGPNRKVTMVYGPAGSTAQSEVVLGTVVVQVKEGAEAGAVTLSQQNTAVSEGDTESQKVSAGSLALTIDKPGAAEMKLMPRDGTQVMVGESFTLDLTVSMKESYAPQMIHSVLVYDSNVLEVVKVEPLSEKSSAAEDSVHQIKWVYFDQTPAVRTGTLTLGSITLKAKDTAGIGSTVIGLQEYDLVVKNGEDIRVIADLTAPDTAMEIVEATQPLSGSVTISGAAVYSETLTADVSGVSPAGATFDLSWYREETAEALAAGSAYTLTAADIGKVITLKAAGAGQFTGELTATTAAVEKAEGPAAPAAPTAASKTDTTVTLTTASGLEYRKGTDGTWQSSGVFAGLTTGTEYTFYARTAETATHKAGAASQALTITTLGYGIALDRQGTVTITPASVGYVSPAATVVTVSNTGTGTVTGLKAALSGTNASSFELSELSATELASGSETTSAGAATFTVTPKTGLTAGTYTADVTVTADKNLSQSVTVSFTVTAKATGGGVTVSGQFTSYDPKKEATFTLTDDADSTKVYTAKVVAESGLGQNTAGFALEGVAAGSYTLVVTKPAHLSFTVKNIVVGETDVDLTQDARAAVKNMELICGDVRRENIAVNADDEGIVKNSANFNQPTDAVDEPLSDFNGDGLVNADDWGILKNSSSFNKMPIVVE